MELRWSNGSNIAITFEAIDASTFANNGIAALRIFRVATERPVHRGETHTNELWYDTPELHVKIGETWYNPGRIKSHGEMMYFDPTPVKIPGLSAKTREEIFQNDADHINQFCQIYWQSCYDCWKWAENLNVVSMRVADMLDKLPAAVELGRRGGSVRSERKAAAARENGRRGGRPRKKAGE